MNISKALVKIFKKKGEHINHAKALFLAGSANFELEHFKEAKSELLQCSGLLNDQFPDDILEKYNEEKVPKDNFDKEVKILKGNTLHLLGRCFYQLGQYARAERTLQEALELRKSYGSLASWIETLVSLSKVEQELNKFDLALEHANLAIKFNESKELEKVIYTNRGTCFMHEDEYLKALEDFMNVELSDEDDLNFKAILKAYKGQCHMFLGQYNSALILYTNVNAICNKIPENLRDPRFVKSLTMTGQAFTMAGDFIRGLNCLEIAYKSAQEMLDPIIEHPLIAECLLQIGILRMDYGDLENARKFFEDALEMQEKVYSEVKMKHLSMVKTYESLAMLYLNQDMIDKASEYLEQGLEVIEALVPEGITHARLLIIKGEIEAQNDDSKAEDIFDEALEMIQNVQGKESRHPGISRIHANLAKIYLDKNDTKKAAEHIDQSLALFKKTFGSIKHQDHATAYEIQALIYINLSEFNLANESFKKALKILRQVFNDDIDDNKMTQRIIRLQDELESRQHLSNGSSKIVF